jgi:hypothetical protein
MATLTITAPPARTATPATGRLARFSDYLSRAFSAYTFSAHAAATSTRVTR